MMAVARGCGRWLAAAALALAPAAARADFDHAHAAWTALLEKHVRVAPNGVSSRVDHRGLSADRARLKAYLASLSAVSADAYARWSRAQQFAFLANAHNAFAVEKILTRDPNLKSIRDFGIVFGNPWKDRFFTLLGRPQHLDGIEHEMLRAQQGDAAAYQRFLQELAGFVRRFLRRRLAQLPDEVEDLVPEILPAVHNRRHTYDPAPPVTAWLHAIAPHKLVDLLRRRARTDC